MNSPWLPLPPVSAAGTSSSTVPPSSSDVDLAVAGVSPDVVCTLSVQVYSDTAFWSSDEGTEL